MNKFLAGILVLELFLTGCGDDKPEVPHEQPTESVEKLSVEKSIEKPSEPAARRDKKSEQPTDVYANRAVDNYNRGNYREALSDASEAIRLDPQNVAAYTYRGHIYNALGDYKRAIQDFNAAILLDGQNSSAYSGRGVAFANSGDYNNAVADLSKAIELDPTAYAYENRGKCYKMLGDDEKAQADFDKARALGND